MKFNTRILAAAGVAASLALASCTIVDTGLSSTAASSSTAAVLAPGIYVSDQNGISVNPGTKSAPVDTIAAGISLAIASNLSNVYVDNSATYDIPSEINVATTKLNILGGYNSNFTAVSGKSIIKATNGYAFYLDNAENILVKNFVITGASNNTESWGAAVFFGTTTNVVVSDCVISNNKAGRGAGAFFGQYAVKSSLVNCQIIGNLSMTNGASGGAVYFYRGISNGIYDCEVVGNSTPAGLGGGVSIARGSNLTIAGSVITNNWAVNDFVLFVGAGAGTDNGLVNLVISNNKLGGTNGATNASGATAIAEEYATSGSAILITGHSIVGNVFYSSMLQYYYRQATGVNSDMNTKSIGDVNTPSWTDAAVATGNTEM